MLQQATAANAGQFLLWLELGRCQEALGFLGPGGTLFHPGPRSSTASAGEAGEALSGACDPTASATALRGWWRRLKK